MTTPFLYRDNRDLHEKTMAERTRLAITQKNIEFILAHQHDSREELSSYLRQCKQELGHVPAQSEIIGGDLLALRFGSWEKALNDSGYLNSIGHAVSAFPLERTAIFQAEYEHQSELHMTESELREKSAGLVENEFFEAHLRSKDHRRLRRYQDIQKSDRLLRIINYGGYAPHLGYIDWDFDGRTMLHTGKYIKYPKDSNCQRWIKRETGRRIRNWRNVQVKGNCLTSLR